MLRKFWPVMAVVFVLATLTTSPALAAGPNTNSPKATSVQATVVTTAGVNLKLRSLPNGGAAVLELLPNGTRLSALGAVQMNAITVNVPVATPDPALIDASAPGASTTGVPATGTVVGFVDTFDNTNCMLGGWAFDGAQSTASIGLQITRDGNPGQPGAVAVGAISANVQRPDVNTAESISGAHGFQIQFDSASGLLDGQTHRLYVNAVMANGGFAPLSNSGATLSCAKAVVSTAPTVDQVWLYVSHPLGAGSVRGWINARYAQVTDKDNSPLSWAKALKKLPVTDPTTLGKAYHTTLPPLTTTTGTTGVSLLTAKTVYVTNLDPDANLTIRQLPNRASTKVTTIKVDTALTVMGRAGDTAGNLWLLVRTADGQQGYVLAYYLTTENPGGDSTAAAVDATPNATDNTAAQPDVPVQPAAAATTNDTPQATAVAPQATAVAPQSTPAPTVAAPAAAPTAAPTSSVPAANP